MSHSQEELEDLLEAYLNGCDDIECAGYTKHKKCRAEVEAKLQARERQLTESLYNELKTEIRDYREQFPDANWDDFLGLIAGMQARHRLAALQVKKGES